MNKNKNTNFIVSVLFLVAIFYGGLPVKAETCTDGNQTGTCSSICSSGTDIPGATGCTNVDQAECCSSPSDPGTGGNNGSSTGIGLDYTLLENIPGTDNLGSDLPGYVSALYKVALVIVTLSAVLMLTIGGFMYLTSAGNTASISSAKSIIYDSLIGLVIALSAWLILYVINPDLVNITLSGISPSQTTLNISTGGSTPPPSGTDAELATQILANRRITLASAGSCKTSDGFVTPKSNIESISQGKRADKCTSGCGPQAIGCLTEGTSISNKMLAAMLTVAGTLSYTVTSISGGPHSNTSAHYSGRAIDIVPVGQALMDAFVRAGALPDNGTRAASMCEDRDGKNVGCGSGSGADHIHLLFP